MLTWVSIDASFASRTNALMKLASLGEVREQALQRDEPLEPFDAALEGAMNRRHPTHAEPFVNEIRTELLFGGDVWPP